MLTVPLLMDTPPKNTPEGSTRSLTAQFTLVGGSVRGTEHRRIDLNNQDAWTVERRPDVLLAIVTDGCGSGRASELGARLGGRALAAALRRRLEAEPDAAAERLLEGARLEVLALLDQTIRAMGGDYMDTLSHCFLFTICGFVVRREETFLFTLGDGIVGVNGKLRSRSFADNAPPYLAYALAPDKVKDPELVRGFDVVLRAPTWAVQNAVVATDGAEDVPDLAKLAGNERLRRNPQVLQRQLTLLNRDNTRVDWDNGIVVQETGALSDDTTVVVLQRND